jgi:fibronectin-binding autotransporter adhesin
VLNDSILNAATPATNITLTSIVVPSAITNNSSVNYTLSGSGSLGGSGPLTKQGSGTLTISTAGGNFKGAVNISGGLLYAGNNCFSAAASILITNNATLDIGGGTFTSNKSITISGSGVNGEGAIFNSYSDYPGESVTIALAGDATIGGSARWDLASGSVISGAHNLTIDGSASGGLANNAYMQWNSVTIGTNVAGLTLTNGQIGSVGNDNSFQNPATVLTISPNGKLIFYGGGWNGSLHLQAGGTVVLSQAPAAINGSIITLESNAQWYAYGGSAAEPINSAVILNGIAHFLVGNYNRIYTNVISGTGGFVMDAYDHAMVLSAVNIYTGPSIISSGPYLALTGNGSISQSSLIFFGGGSSTSTHIDVSGRTDQTLTLANGQTLAGVGAISGSLVVSSGATLSPSGTNTTIGITTGANSSGAISVTNAVTLNAGSMTVIKLNGSGVNDQVQTGGSINYGGTLNLVNINASPLANGNSFQVFQSGTAVYNGSFTSIVPATPGAGLAWDLSQLSSGIIGVKAGATGPVIGGTTLSGGKLILNGTGGTANATYYELSTTNLLTPLAGWIPVLTNTFSATGTFSVTNALVPGVPQQFYIIKQP